MEVSVGFADKEEAYYLENGYACEKSELGNVYYRPDKIVLGEEPAVNYMIFPWISTFEVENIECRKQTD